ncbi:Uncharacterised protein [Legionella beliardensis]|uniref:Uncharacterized protein n=1 Tax=Legionella beliardensis TaxID=91822 RepID=A0A378I5E2_9GAMM|nr:hypothetical protein [Legionella beliardensis]STX29945.1 Uncharacterised protein [Legionella beliardensis]
MKVRKLSYAQFKVEKQKILAIVRGWENTYKEFFDKNYSIMHNSDLRYHWRESIVDMINFLEKNITEQTGSNLEKNGFALFIAEDDNENIQGMALGGGLRTYGGYSNTFFGMSGTFYEIKEMIISASSMLSRCYQAEDKVLHKSIGKELLKAIINHVQTQAIPYPIAARPHHSNEIAHKFFEKYLFTLGCGSLGHSYTLNVAEFGYIDQSHHKECIASTTVVVFDDYKSPTMHF